MSSLESNSHRASQVAANLAVDLAGAKVRGRLADEQIECLLLKGRGIAERLYDQVWERSYSDTDLLIRLEDRERAEAVLVALGYRRIDRDSDRLGAPGYAHTFHGPDGALIDLHWNLSGVAAPPAATWAALYDRTTWLTVGGRPARVPNDEALALIVALHNAHHGARWSSTTPDLERALARIQADDWMAAAKLADELGAHDAFAAGLRLSSAGGALADRIGAGEALPLEYQLRAGETPYRAWALHRLATARGVTKRVRVTLQLLLPPPYTMRQFFPLARRGRAGLIAAYVLRPVRLAASAVPTVAEYLKARADARRSR